MAKEQKLAEKARQKQEKWLSQTHATKEERAWRDRAFKRGWDLYGFDHAMKKAKAITIQRKNCRWGPSVNMKAERRKVQLSELGFDADE